MPRLLGTMTGTLTPERPRILKPGSSFCFDTLFSRRKNTHKTEQNSAHIPITHSSRISSFLVLSKKTKLQTIGARKDERSSPRGKEQPNISDGSEQRKSHVFDDARDHQSQRPNDNIQARLELQPKDPRPRKEARKQCYTTLGETESTPFGRGRHRTGFTNETAASTARDDGLICWMCGTSCTAPF